MLFRSGGRSAGERAGGAHDERSGDPAGAAAGRHRGGAQLDGSQGLSLGPGLWAVANKKPPPEAGAANGSGDQNQERKKISDLKILPPLMTLRTVCWPPLENSMEV